MFTALLPFVDQKVLYDKYDTSVNWSEILSTAKSSTSGSVSTSARPPRNAVSNSTSTPDLTPGNWSPGGTFQGIVAVGDYAASLGIDPRLNNTTFPATAATPSAPLRPLLFPSAQFTTNATASTNGFLPRTRHSASKTSRTGRRTRLRRLGIRRPAVRLPEGSETGRPAAQPALRQRRRLVPARQRHPVRRLEQGEETRSPAST